MQVLSDVKKKKIAFVFRIPFHNTNATIISFNSTIAATTLIAYFRKNHEFTNSAN